MYLNGTAAATAVNVSAGNLVLAGAGGCLTGSPAIAVSAGALTVNGAETANSFTLTGGTLGGSGTLTANTYSLQNGEIDGGLGAGAITAGTGATTVGPTGRLGAASSVAINSGSLVLASGQSVAGFQITGGTLTGSGTLNVNGTVPIDAQNGTVSSSLGGSAGLSKTTTGTVFLTAANSYSGGTTLSVGTLDLSEAGNLGAHAGTVTIGAATLQTSGAIALDNADQFGRPGRHAGHAQPLGRHDAQRRGERQRRLEQDRPGHVGPGQRGRKHLQRRHERAGRHRFGGYRRRLVASEQPGDRRRGRRWF